MPALLNRPDGKGRVHPEILEGMLAERALARRHFATYYQLAYAHQQAGAWQIDLCNELEAFLLAVERGESPVLIVEAPPQHGKAIAHGEMVPMLGGMTPIEQIKVGEYVIGSDGRPTRVVAKKTWRDRVLYRVTTDDGHSVVVDGEHEWRVRLCRKQKAWSIRTTAFLAERKCTRAAMIQMVRVVGRAAELTTDPYTLGVWLGDGSKSSSLITKGAEDMQHIAARIRAAGYDVTDCAKPGTIYVRAMRGKFPLNNKHIPEPYFHASVEQRMALLNGLVDTDGYVAPDGQVEYCSTDEALAVGVARLVHTLGVKAQIVTGRATLNGRDYGPKWRIMFYMKDAASLPRKRAKTRDAAKKPNRYITAERLPNRGDTTCIQVEAADHLYAVTTACIVTHNSQIVSRAFPAWMMGRHPDMPVILGSYAAKLAEGHGRWVRNRLASDENRALFPGTELAPDSSAVDTFSTTEDGQMASRGVGGGTTGQPAAVFICDDPFADREEADSENQREKVWDWYCAVVNTRLRPGGGVLIMHTRWHVDDLVGRVVQQAKEDTKIKPPRVLSYPALCDSSNDRIGRKIGEALHADRKPHAFKVSDYEDKRRKIGERDFQSLYQQKPFNEEGGYFKAANHRTYTEEPKTGERYIAADFAYKKGKDNDYLSAGPFGLAKGGELVWGKELFVERLGTLAGVQRILDMARTLGIKTLVTGRPDWQAVGPLMEKLMAGDKHADPPIPSWYMTVEEIPEITDLERRSRSFQGYHQRNMVLWPDTECVKQLVLPMMLAFPAHKHDDPIAMAAMACQYLDEQTERRDEVEKPKEAPKRHGEVRARAKTTREEAPTLFGRTEAKRASKSMGAILAPLFGRVRR